MSFWNSIAALLTAALSLLGFVHTSPTLPQTQQVVSQTTGTPSSSSSAAQATAGSQQSSSSELVISEWGVQFQKPKDMEDLYYVMYGQSIAFSTQQLQEMDPGCAAANDPLGSQSRYAHSSSYAGEMQTIGAYDYAFIERNAGSCSTNSAASALASHQQGELENAIDTTLQSVTSSGSSGNDANSNDTNVKMAYAPADCSDFATLKLGDTDATTNGRVSALQSFLGVTPVSGTYGPKTQLAYENECVGGNAQPISVSGMSEYTDSTFGFSFWYPSSWIVQQITSPYQQEYQGGTILKSFKVWNGNQSDFVGVEVDEFESPGMSITDQCFSCVDQEYGPEGFRLYFDSEQGEWMTADLLNPNAPVPADVSNNTMGGLHIFAGAQRFQNDDIVPLSATKFLILNSLEAGDPDRTTLTKTIVATDPSVGLRASTAQQSATIEAEQQAYAGQ